MVLVFILPKHNLNLVANFISYSMKATKGYFFFAFLPAGGC